MELKVKKLSNTAQLPKRMTEGAAGYDLYAAEDCIIKSADRAVIKTDLAITVPEGSYGRIAGRSGLAINYGITIGGGVIDSDYTGNVGVILFNHGSMDYPIKIGDRIAQLIIEKYYTPIIVEVETLEFTERTGGFGSTGKV